MDWSKSKYFSLNAKNTQYKKFEKLISTYFQAQIHDKTNNKFCVIENNQKWLMSCLSSLKTIGGKAFIKGITENPNRIQLWWRRTKVERRIWTGKTNDLSFASTETKFKNPITKTQNNFLVNTGFLVKLFQKKPKW